MKSIFLKRAIFCIALSIFAQDQAKALNATFTPGTPVPVPTNSTLTITPGPVGAGNDIIRNVVNYMNANRATSIPLDINYNAFAHIPETGDAANVITEYNMYKSLASALTSYNIGSVNIDLSVATANQYNTLVEDWLTSYAYSATDIKKAAITVAGKTTGDLWANGSFSSLLKAASPHTNLTFSNCFISQVAPSVDRGVASVTTPSVPSGMNLQSGICTQGNLAFNNCYLGSSHIAFPQPIDGSVPRCVLNWLLSSAVTGGNTITVTYNAWQGSSASGALASINTLGWDPTNYGDVNGTPLGNWADLGVDVDFGSYTSIVATLDNNASPAVTLRVPSSVIVTSIQQKLKQNPWNSDLLAQAKQYKVTHPFEKGIHHIQEKDLSALFTLIKDNTIDPRRVIITDKKASYNGERRELHLPLETLLGNWEGSKPMLRALQEGVRESSAPLWASSASAHSSRGELLSSLVYDIGTWIDLVRVNDTSETGVGVQNGKMIIKMTKDEILEEGKKRAQSSDPSSLAQWVSASRPWAKADLDRVCQGLSKDATNKIHISENWIQK